LGPVGKSWLWCLAPAVINLYHRRIVALAGGSGSLIPAGWSYRLAEVQRASAPAYRTIRRWCCRLRCWFGVPYGGEDEHINTGSENDTMVELGTSAPVQRTIRWWRRTHQWQSGILYGGDDGHTTAGTAYYPAVTMNSSVTEPTKLQERKYKNNHRSDQIPVLTLP
jgi:hypothetical protein